MTNNRILRVVAALSVATIAAAMPCGAMGATMTAYAYAEDTEPAP